MAVILSLKLLLISISVVSISILVKLSIPIVIHFVCYQIPLLWSYIMCLLRPPQLYFVINGIIITIALSSRFHLKRDDEESEPLMVPLPPRYCDDVAPESGDVESEEVVKSVVMYGKVEEIEEETEEEFVISRSTWTPPLRSKSMERLPGDMPLQKPLVSTSFVTAPKTSSPRGGLVLKGVAKHKRNDTMENTWKTITEGGRKCDTWENQLNSADENITLGPTKPVVKKSATFRDRTNYEPVLANSSPVPSIRKEPSLSQDELNRRVEAFIRKFNEDMKLQRQESFNHYMDMMNRGVH